VGLERKKGEVENQNVCNLKGQQQYCWSERCGFDWVSKGISRLSKPTKAKWARSVGVKDGDRGRVREKKMRKCWFVYLIAQGWELRALICVCRPAPACAAPTVLGKEIFGGAALSTIAADCVSGGAGEKSRIIWGKPLSGVWGVELPKEPTLAKSVTIALSVWVPWGNLARDRAVRWIGRCGKKWRSNARVTVVLAKNVSCF